MPNHKSCVKKFKVTERRRKLNLDKKQRFKAVFKKLMNETDLKKAEELLNIAKKKLDKICGKHIYHRNKVNRLKSKCDKKVNVLRSL